ncbi:MAG: chemotaxis protein CheX [Desulfobacteraceae bacterium]|nr:chemotaxis protein CheX [Desulfobacteraceae bacterium]
MDVRLINPFLEAAVNVIKTMARIEPKAGRPFLKNDFVASGDVSGVIGITGQVQGSMSISFTGPCIKAVVAGLFGSSVNEINDEVRDAVGELTNMICGDARRRLESDGISLSAGTPTVISGEKHVITHINKGPCIALPFETSDGTFVIEVAFND